MKVTNLTLDSNSEDDTFIEKVHSANGVHIANIIKWNNQHYFRPRKNQDFGSRCLTQVVKRLKELDIALDAANEY